MLQFRDGAVRAPDAVDLLTGNIIGQAALGGYHLRRVSKALVLLLVLRSLEAEHRYGYRS